MPRTKAQAKKESQIVVLIKGYLAAHDTAATRKSDKLYIEGLAVSVGMTQSTLSRRLKNPETFTAAELNRIGRKLHIPIELLRAAAIAY